MSTPVTTTEPVIDAKLRSTLAARKRPPRPNPLAASLTLSWRTLLKIKHTIFMQLIEILFMPVIFLLIFNYLFGGAFAGSTGEYLQYFLPGVLVMTVVMITASTGTALNTDIAKGIFDRFRTLPFWQPAAVVGTMIADIGRYLIALLLTIVLGLTLGFRPDAGVLGAVLAILLILLFAFAIGWIFTTIGLLVKQPESVAFASMITMFPLVFTSNIFVSSLTMPTWMQTIVNLNPISHASTAARGLMHGTATPWQISLVLLSSAVVIAVFAPTTMYLYHRKN
ncbi:ABC transporter permease [Amycolatopsis sp. cmx-11-12]|uniref:ABC transporter permease n=1 Tax=Amycolatopsis sp. cmx-11-12 TaxID=2785795 RepID=UPI0039181DFD